jgi:hypothetical protein
MDFLIVPTVDFRLLFVLVILGHERRRLISLNVTAIRSDARQTEEIYLARQERYRKEHEHEVNEAWKKAYLDFNDYF